MAKKTNKKQESSLFIDAFKKDNYNDMVNSYINFYKKNKIKALYTNNKICDELLEIVEHDFNVKQCLNTIYNEINCLGFTILNEDGSELRQNLQFINDFIIINRQLFISIGIQTWLYGMRSIELDYQTNLNDEYYTPKSIKILKKEKIKEDNEGVFTLTLAGEKQYLNKFRYMCLLSHDIHLNETGDSLIEDLAGLVIIGQGALKDWGIAAHNFSQPTQVLKLDNPSQKIEGRNLTVGEHFDKMLENSTGPKSLGLGINDSFEILNFKTDNEIFKSICEFQKDAIARLILGQNLTSDVKGGSYAAAETHGNQLIKNIKSQIAHTNQCANKIIANILAANDITDKVIFKFNNPEELNLSKLERDKIAYDLGVRFKKQYFINNYGFTNEDIDIDNSSTINAKSNTQFEKLEFVKKEQLQDNPPNTNLIIKHQQEIDEIIDDAINKNKSTFNSQLINLIDVAESPQDLLNQMAKLANKFDHEEDFNAISDALITADIAGYVFEDKLASLS